MLLVRLLWTLFLCNECAFMENACIFNPNWIYMYSEMLLYWEREILTLTYSGTGVLKLHSFITFSQLLLFTTAVQMQSHCLTCCDIRFNPQQGRVVPTQHHMEFAFLLIWSGNPSPQNKWQLGAPYEDHILPLNCLDDPSLRLRDKWKWSQQSVNRLLYSVDCRVQGLFVISC